MLPSLVALNTGNAIGGHGGKGKHKPKPTCTPFEWKSEVAPIQLPQLPLELTVKNASTGLLQGLRIMLPAVEGWSKLLDASIDMQRQDSSYAVMQQSGDEVCAMLAAPGLEKLILDRSSDLPDSQQGPHAKAVELGEKIVGWRSKLLHAVNFTGELCDAGIRQKVAPAPGSLVTQLTLIIQMVENAVDKLQRATEEGGVDVAEMLARRGSDGGEIIFPNMDEALDSIRYLRLFLEVFNFLKNRVLIVQDYMAKVIGHVLQQFEVAKGHLNRQSTRWLTAEAVVPTQDLKARLHKIIKASTDLLDTHRAHFEGQLKGLTKKVKHWQAQRSKAQANEQHRVHRREPQQPASLPDDADGHQRFVDLERHREAEARRAALKREHEEKARAAAAAAAAAAAEAAAAHPSQGTREA